MIYIFKLIVIEEICAIHLVSICLCLLIQTLLEVIQRYFVTIAMGSKFQANFTKRSKITVRANVVSGIIHPLHCGFKMANELIDVASRKTGFVSLNLF